MPPPPRDPEEKENGGQPPKGGKPALFISHSSLDKTFVNRLLRELRNAGISDYWYDAFQIDGATEDVSRALTRGIRAARWFALVLSPRSAASSWVTYEVDAAQKAGVRAIVLMYDSPDGHLGYLSNPHLSDFLRGGQRKVIDFTREFDRGLTELLLVVAPEVGQERNIRLTLDQIIEQDDPDVAERAISYAALSPERFLPPLLDRVPDLRDDAKLGFRVKAAMAAIGRPALEPLLDFVFRQRELPPHAQLPYPEVEASGKDTSGAEYYSGSAAKALIRHMILTGGNREWAAQIGAERCLVAMADKDPDLRREISQYLRDQLVTATSVIASVSDKAEVTDEFYDVLRLAIETMGLVTAPGKLDDFLLNQFVADDLWSWQSDQAKDKLSSYVIRALGSSASDDALGYLEAMLDDPYMDNLYFTGSRSPNPWDDAFVPFGLRAVDRLLGRRESMNPKVLTKIYLNLAQIRHPRGLEAALAWASQQETSPYDAGKIILCAAAVGLPSLCDKLLALYTTGALQRFDNEVFAERVDEAAVVAARNATDQASAAAVCGALIGTGDAWLKVELAKTIPAIGAYDLYGVVRAWLSGDPNIRVRTISAISLCENGVIKTPEPIIEEMEYAEPGAAPLFAVALSYFGRPEAVEPLANGLRQSLLIADDTSHELFASALRRIDSDQAREAFKKWYHRI
jgi:hypothetical protein